MAKQHVELLLCWLSDLRRGIVVYTEEADGSLTLSSDGSLAYIEIVSAHRLPE